MRSRSRSSSIGRESDTVLPSLIMVDPNKPTSGIPEDEGRSASEPIARIHSEVTGMHEAARKALDPFQRLKQLRSPESRERISPKDYDANEIAKHAKHGVPIRRSDLAHSTGEQPVVMAFEEFEVIRDDLADDGREMQLFYIDRSGRKVAVTENSFSEGGAFVLFPDEVGEKESASA